MKKNDQTKELLLEQLKKTPIIQIACEKMGIARATLYRWKDEDPAFAEKIDKAVREGCLMVNDLAESQLIGAVKDRNIQAIMYWLRHHHADYTNRIEVEAKLTSNQPLTSEQETVIRQAMELATMTTPRLTDTPYGQSKPTESSTDNAGDTGKSDCG